MTSGSLVRTQYTIGPLRHQPHCPLHGIYRLIGTAARISRLSCLDCGERFFTSFPLVELKPHEYMACKVTL